MTLRAGDKFVTVDRRGVVVANGPERFLLLASHDGYFRGCYLYLLHNDFRNPLVRIRWPRWLWPFAPPGRYP